MILVWLSTFMLVFIMLTLGVFINKKSVSSSWKKFPIWLWIWSFKFLSSPLFYSVFVITLIFLFWCWNYPAPT